MTKRIFLDVGANTGQSLAAALDPVFRFDEIICFEPASVCWPRLRAMADARVRIEKFGLWNQTWVMPIFNPGSLGAGIWQKDKDKLNVAAIRAAPEPAQFRRASTWFGENLDQGDVIFMKLNCEGAECDILDDLLDSGEFRKVSFAMIDFDVRKIAAQKHREAETRQRLEVYPFPIVAFSKQVMKGATHQERIKNWLRVVEEKPGE